MHQRQGLDRDDRTRENFQKCNRLFFKTQILLAPTGCDVGYLLIQHSSNSSGSTYVLFIMSCYVVTIRSNSVYHNMNSHHTIAMARILLERRLPHRDRG